MKIINGTNKFFVTHGRWKSFFIACGSNGDLGLFVLKIIDGATQSLVAHEPC
jgi:hypothetical protein